MSPHHPQRASRASNRKDDTLDTDTGDKTVTPVRPMLVKS